MDSAKPSLSLARPTPTQTKATGPAHESGSAKIEPSAAESSFYLHETNRVLLDSSTDGVYGTDANGIISFINGAAAKMTGWTAQDLVGKPQDAFAHQIRPWSSSGLSAAALLGQRRPSEKGTVVRGENAVFLRKDGSSFSAAYTHASIMRQGRLAGTVVVFRDSSEDKRQEAWEKSKTEIVSAILRHQSLQATMQMAADAFAARRPEKSIAIFLLQGEMFSLQAEAGLPRRPGRVVPGHNAKFLIAPPTRVESLAHGHSPVLYDPRAGPSGPDLEEILKTGVKLCLASPLMSGTGEARGAVTVFDQRADVLDKTSREAMQTVCDLARFAIEHRRLHDEMLHRSNFDGLTGLPNRQFLEDQLRAAMVTARRQNKLIAACCLDLDHFKRINDTLGHVLGDNLFKAVNERLRTSVRELDILARSDGDEFILVLCDLEEPSDAENVCHRLVKALRTPFLVDGHSLTITASVGISVFPEHGETSDGLLRNASLALRKAKRAGPGTVRIYSPDLGQQNRRAAEMVEALVSAVAEGQFCMAYQPIYAMSNEIVAFEALLRWKHPQWGQISPLEFIPVAEASGLIVPIGDWVINEVCRQAREWDAAGVPPVKIFANISGVQLGRPDFASKIAEALQRSGLAPERLELEITESWVISDLKGAARKLQKLRDLGIGIAIDDFGTGYSMFNYLQELPLDTLKIDRSFIQRLDGSAANPSTVRAIAELARQLGLKTVAEGVETERHVMELAQIGCDLMQGFFLARPLKPEAACVLLKEQPSHGFAEVAVQRAVAKHRAIEYVTARK